MSHLDRGAAYAVLRTDWRDLPREEREAAFLDALELCVEPDPAPAPHSNVPVVLYVITNAWLIFGSIVRLGISFTHHIPVDALPFLSLVLGNGALIWYFRLSPRPRKEHS